MAESNNGAQSQEQYVHTYYLTFLCFFMLSLVGSAPMA